MTGSGPRVEVRRAEDRFVTRTDWLESRHAFSYGVHYDPANTSHGVLVSHNDDVVQAGGGFDRHPHRDLEIVTWVLSGALAHEDSTGARGLVAPGVVQRLSAGRGVEHSEHNAATRPGGGEPVHYVQMWVVPDEAGGEPEHAQRDVTPELRAGGLVAVASGRPEHASALRLRNRSAALHVARLPVGQGVELPQAPYLHVSVPVGAVVLEGTGPLGTGDAARLTAAGGRLTAVEAAEVLVWEMHARPGQP